MRISNYIRQQISEASKQAFGEAKILLFGSRLDDSLKGGDFDIAVITEVDKEDFKKAKVQFFKHLLLKDLDIPIDVVHYKYADKLLQSEIDKGVSLT